MKGENAPESKNTRPRLPDACVSRIPGFRDSGVGEIMVASRQNAAKLPARIETKQPVYYFV